MKTYGYKEIEDLKESLSAAPEVIENLVKENDELNRQLNEMRNRIVILEKDDSSILSDEQNDAWKNCTRSDAIIQADAKHKAYMELNESFNHVCKQRDDAREQLAQLGQKWELLKDLLK